MMNKKWIRVTGIVFTLFVITFWYFNAPSILNTALLKVKPKILGAFTDPNRGYASITNYYIFYGIPFLFLVRYLAADENYSYIMRTHNRKKIMKNRIRIILLFSLIFVTVHLFVLTMGAHIFIGPEYLEMIHFNQSLAAQGINNWLFYIIMAILYYLVSDIVNSKEKGIFLLIIGYFLFFEGSNLVFNLNNILEGSILYPMMMNQYDGLSYLLLLLKQILIAASVFYVSVTIFERKDILNET